MSLPRRHKRRIALAGAMIAALTGLCFLITPLGEGLTEMSYDLPFYFREDIKPEDVVIVYMDWDSHVRLHQEEFRRWDRTLHARLLDRLREMQAKVVSFDVVFLPTTNTPTADAEFVAAAKRHGRVAVGAMVAPDVQEGQIVGWRLTKPFPELEAVAKWGVVEVGDENRSVRQHYFRRDYEAPSLAWRAAELATDEPPSEPFRERWVNYYGPPGIFPHYSFWEVLATNAIPADAFSNKVVFVGALYDIGMTGGKGTDDFRTPYTRKTGRRSPGVEVTATAYLNLVQRDWLSRLRPSVEAVVILVAGALAGLGLGYCRPMLALGLGALGFLLVASSALLLVWWKLSWFPWLIVGVVQIPCAVGWSIISLARRPDEKPTTKAEEETPRVPDYELLRCIGKGGYGEVWLARSAVGVYTAVKIVYRHSFSEDAPYNREFNGLRKFTPISRGHPAFVHILHVGRNDDEGYFYYVMEAADDEASGQKIDVQTYSPKNLAKDLKRLKRLPLDECLQLGVDLSSALDFLHQHQLIHRDIKPANIIFVNGAAKLADIGLVTDVAKDGGGVTSLGTQGYIPPEGPGTAAGDIYGLGKVLYEASVGLEVDRFPELPTALVSDPNEDAFFELNAIVLKACENVPSNRYTSAAELRDALASLQNKLHPQKVQDDENSNN